MALSTFQIGKNVGEGIRTVNTTHLAVPAGLSCNKRVSNKQGISYNYFVTAEDE
jgi:hypothetical protein